jgi:hypothetical protein
MEQLHADRLCEALDRVLRGAVRGLERDGPLPERGSDLDYDAAIPRKHPRQRRPSPVGVAEVGDPRNLLELVGRDVDELREHRDHRVVHPHVDRAQAAFDLLGGVLDLGGVRDVGWDGKRSAAGGNDLVGGGVEPVVPARKQANVPPELAKPTGDGPSDARGGARDDSDSGGRRIHRRLRFECDRDAAGSKRSLPERLRRQTRPFGLRG